MYSPDFFARKMMMRTKEGEKEVFSDVNPDIRLTRMYGAGPYYKIRIHEASKNEEPQLWGWKDFQEKKYINIYPLKEFVRIFHPTFPVPEEKQGDIVGFVVDHFETIY